MLKTTTDSFIFLDKLVINIDSLDNTIAYEIMCSIDQLLLNLSFLLIYRTFLPICSSFIVFISKMNL